jgi:hypothetical protein
MKTGNRIILAVAAATMLATSGCVKLWQKTLDVKSYMIEASRDLQAAAQPLGDKLWIDAVSVLPPFNIRNLVLRKSDVEFDESFYTELLISPSENFRNNFFIWFSDSGVFQDVSILNRKGMSHRLAISVTQFYGVRMEGKEAAVLTIKATLFDERTQGLRVLFNKEYRVEESIGDITSENLIRGYNRALVKILTDCEKDVIGALK